MTADATRARRLRRIFTAVAVALSVLALIATVIVMDPLPPRTVVMATGAPGSAYARIALRYQAVLARSGVRLVLRETNGAMDNLALLADQRAGVSVALADGGLASADAEPEVVSLGTVFYEPIWLFYRGRTPPRAGTAGFTGRIAIGRPGSGTRALAEKLLPVLGWDLTKLHIAELTSAQAGDSLLDGRLDVLVMVNDWESPMVMKLAAAPGITTMSAPHADAQVALRPYLSKLLFPRGVADLANDRPPADVHLIAAKASLLARKDLHPAIQYLLLHAASEVNGGPGIFQSAGQFPAAESMDFPLSEPATQYYKSGRPWLQRALPFWLASFVSELLVLLVPIVGVIYPLFKLLPAAYGFAMQRRIFRLYDELKYIEMELEAGGGAPGEPPLSARLEDLEQRADHLRVSRAYMQSLYTLRIHIGLVRDRIARSAGEARTAAP